MSTFRVLEVTPFVPLFAKVRSEKGVAGTKVVAAKAEIGERILFLVLKETTKLGIATKVEFESVFLVMLLLPIEARLLEMLEHFVEIEIPVVESVSLLAVSFEGGRSVLIVLPSLFGIGQNFVSLRYFLKLLFRTGFFVFVGMILHGKFAERFLDLPVRRLPLNAEDFVIVAVFGDDDALEEREQRRNKDERQAFEFHRGT